METSGDTDEGPDLFTRQSRCLDPPPTSPIRPARIALITEPYTGLGFEIGPGPGRHGATVVLACRLPPHRGGGP